MMSNEDNKKRAHEQEQQKQKYFFHGQPPVPAAPKQHDHAPASISADNTSDTRPDAPILSPLAKQVTDDEVVVPVAGGKTKKISSPLFDRTGKKQRHQKSIIDNTVAETIKVENLKAAVKQAFAALDAAKQAIIVLEVEANKLVKQLAQQALLPKNMPKMDNKKGR